MSTDTLAYCPRDSAHGKWLNYGQNCPCQPRTTFNVIGPNGTFTESFTASQVELLERMGFIKFDHSQQYGNHTTVHYYTPKEN